MNSSLQAALNNTIYLLIEVTEVNTANQWVEGIDRMRSPYRVEWATHGPGIVYAPKVGEQWIIGKLNNTWKLMWRYESASASKPINTLLPGSVRIEGDRVYLMAEELYINRNLFEDRGHVYNEIPIGLKNGVNTLFTVTNNFISGTIRLYRNGLRELITETSQEKQFLVTIAPASDDDLIVDYDYIKPPPTLFVD